MRLDPRRQFNRFGYIIEGFNQPIELSIFQKDTEKSAERALAMMKPSSGYKVESFQGVIDHACFGVAGDDADEEAFGSGEVRVGFLGFEDPLHEVEAVGARELLDGGFVEESIAVEVGGGDGGGLEEVGEAVRVGFGEDSGFCCGGDGGFRGFGFEVEEGGEGGFWGFFERGRHWRER